MRCYRILVAIFLIALAAGACAKTETVGVMECPSVGIIVDSKVCEDFAATAFGAAFYTCVGFDEDCPAPPEEARRMAEKEARDNCTAACRAKTCRADRELPCRPEELPLKERTRKVVDLNCVDVEKPIECQVMKAGICTCSCRRIF